jgi:pimeloyl-ACP methyl ester carboxylesterase
MKKNFLVIIMGCVVCLGLVGLVAVWSGLKAPGLLPQLGSQGPGWLAWVGVVFLVLLGLACLGFLLRVISLRVVAAWLCAVGVLPVGLGLWSLVVVLSGLEISVFLALLGLVLLLLLGLACLGLVLLALSNLGGAPVLREVLFGLDLVLGILVALWLCLHVLLLLPPLLGVVFLVLLGLVVVISLIRLSVTIQKVTYKSDNPNMKGEIEVSALLIKPIVKGNTHLKLLSFQHGTYARKDQAPSCFKCYMPWKYWEVYAAMIVAIFGRYMVVMPDYQGMGEAGLKQVNKDIDQPYVAREPLARSVCDLLAAVTSRDDIKSNWNNQLYMFGYSQGGYVTMAAARELQLSDKPEYKKLMGNFKACAPCAGPYSLSQTVRQIMVGKKPYSLNAFVPMLVRGFNARYGNIFNMGAFKSTPVDYRETYNLADGYHTTDEIGEKMPDIPSEALTEDFLQKLEDGGAGHKVLEENDAYYKWCPSMPMTLYHCPDDEVVPYENSIIAQSEFEKRGVGVQLVPIKSWLIIKPHMLAFLPCLYLLAANKWFKKVSLPVGDGACK